MSETPNQTEPKASVNESNMSQTRQKDNILDLDDFRSLQSGSHIEIHRTQPGKIAGYLGYLTVPDGGIGDIYEEVQGSYGGGKYQLRAKKLSAGGGLKYAMGAVQIAVGGYPVQGGMHYINDQWRPIPVPVAQSTPVFAPPQRANGLESQGDGLVGMMREFVGQALQANLRGDPSGVKLTELPSLLTAIAGLQGPQRERDDFRDMERALGLIEKLDARRESSQPAQPAQATDGSGMENMVQMLLMKFLGTQGQPPPPTVSAPTQAPSMGQNYPSYPPNMSGREMWEQTGGHPQPQPPGWTTPPQPPQAAGGAPVDTPPAAAAPSPTHEPAGEYEPLSVDEIMEDLATRDEKGREKFLGELCEKLGLDAAILQTMFPKGPGVPLDGTFGQGPK